MYSEAEAHLPYHQKALIEGVTYRPVDKAVTNTDHTPKTATFN